MKTLPALGLAAALCTLVPATSSAQIISTMVPMDSAPSAGAGSSVAFHVMGGYSNWNFGFIDDPTVKETGGHSGFIGAADIVFATSSGLSVGAGGWYNKVQDIKDTGTNFSGTQTLSISSVYGNVFARYIGVQVGVIPLKSQATANTFTGTSDASQTDLDAFLVGRFGTSPSNGRRVSGSVGLGVYRFGSRPVTQIADASPSAMAPTGFANVSLPIISHVSLDASFWYTAKDKNFTSSNADIGNASQRRFVIGIGLQN